MLESRLPQIILYSPVKVTAAVRRAESAIEREAMARSRVATGNMRSGWQSHAMGPAEGMVFNLVEYTIYNEYGTVYMSAQPMLRPAVEQARPAFEAELAGAFL
jgi:HK97 gp10 family phage protein